MPSEQDHVKQTAKSQRLLKKAREKARRKNGYEFAKTRQQYKKPAYEWQIDVAEALVLGLDAVVTAGTGAGKTIPFMMPLLLHREKFVLVISPLKILQEDQGKRFKKMGLKAAAVNGDTYSGELKEHILAVIIDEAHCAAQWGGDFRPHYTVLNRLRVLLPVGTPLLATSATLNADAMAEICSGLDLDLDRSFFLNLGNDRPNITPSVVRMNGSKDYAALDPVLPSPADVQSADDLPKATIFTNNVKKTQVICRHVRRLYPHLRGAIDFLHAHRSVKAKRRVMKQFRKGKIKILIATEAAGMVRADIPDIELVIQFGVPSSLSVWIQRAGRADRSPELHAHAILLVEKSMFQPRKKRKRGAGKETSAAREPVSSDSDSSSESGAENPPPTNTASPADRRTETTATPTAADDGLEWGKRVDPVLCEYISSEVCHRDMTDHYFDNPPRRPATGKCCKNCTAIEERKNCPPPPTPQTPEPQGSQPSSAHSTPSKCRNGTGKRSMVPGDPSTGPKTRQKEHLKSRINTYLGSYSNCAFTYDSLLPNTFLTSLASHRTATLEALAELVPAWAFVEEHGADVLRVLTRIDDAERAERERERR
ncbi:P-loop containing nucleoside triphosphate hydrolase protein [Mycena vulgaris]|nr:P-loop containing nucleoside triphosphate hydrolase protein [Mycena vulgaris]